jgi:hypothetical protein
LTECQVFVRFAHLFLAEVFFTRLQQLIPMK